MAVAEPTRSYRYSVINPRGQVFSLTLRPVTRAWVQPGSPQSEISAPTAPGQRLLGAMLHAAGVYDRPVGPSVPLTGQDALAHTGPVGVSIDYN